MKKTSEECANQGSEIIRPYSDSVSLIAEELEKIAEVLGDYNVKRAEEHSTQDVLVMLEAAKMLRDSATRFFPLSVAATADGYYDGRPVWDQFNCPICDADLGEGDMHPKFCPECGQALSWEGFEECR